MVFFRQMIVDTLDFIKLKWSDSPYSGMGNIVRFNENGKKWKVWKISWKTVILEGVEDDEDTSTREMMKISTSDYVRSKLYYKKV